MPKINIDQLAIEVMQELDAYREDVQEAVEKAVKETAKADSCGITFHITGRRYR